MLATQVDSQRRGKGARRAGRTLTGKWFMHGLLRNKTTRGGGLRLSGGRCRAHQEPDNPGTYRIRPGFRWLPVRMARLPAGRALRPGQGGCQPAGLGVLRGGTSVPTGVTLRSIRKPQLSSFSPEVISASGRQCRIVTISVTPCRRAMPM